MMKTKVVLALVVVLCGISSCHPFIHGAVKSNDLERVKAYVAEGHVNDREEDHRHTPLIMASYYGHTKIVKYLCKNGADPDAQAIDGSTALIYAVYYNYVDIVKILLDNGASVDLKDRKGHTALYYAKMHRDNEIFLLLKLKGAKRW